MTRLRGSWTAAAAVTLFLLSACARTDAVGAPGESASPSSVPAPADQLVLRVEQTGGFAGPGARIGQLPTVSVYGDGRVITQGPQIAIYPGPALPNLLVQQASPATVDGLVAKGRQLAAAAPDLGRPGVADASTTRITVSGRTIDAYALQEAPSNDTALTPAQQAARAKLTAFVEQLTGLPGTKGMPEAQPYQAEAVAVLSRPWVKPADSLPKPPAATPWPGPALPGDYLQPGVKQGCLTVTGAEAGKVLAAAANANQSTPWKSGTATWSVSFRPLLPDESGCADLRAPR
ncbi:MAG TPA: hypothetical protein VGP57_20870 [Actinoplanes sp.]|nr:hypothetical protein [Actinoplanes sp.]